MTRLVLALLGWLLVPATVQTPHPTGRLDASGGFFYPEFSTGPGVALADLVGGGVGNSTYLRYLATRLGTRLLEDLSFDIALARECRARRLAGAAPVLARAVSARDFDASGRVAGQDPGGHLRRKLANEALRRMRIEALVRADRQIDEAAVRDLFERRYGVGGQHVRLRQILVSFAATRRRAAGGGADLDREAVVEAATQRARGILARIRAGQPFEGLLAESDDRATRRMLRDPARRGDAGYVSGYDQQRHGEAFARAVASLEVGAVSEPVKSEAGLHLIELVERRTTRLADVAPALRRQIGARRATHHEIQTLRAALLEKYRFRSK